MDNYGAQDNDILYNFLLSLKIIVVSVVNIFN